MPRPLLLPPGQQRRSACAADHLLAILVSTLPPCAALSAFAVHITFHCVELFERSFQKCTTASSGYALFKVGQAGMDGPGREMYHKSDGASGDAFVTVLTHDRVQLPISHSTQDSPSQVAPHAAARTPSSTSEHTHLIKSLQQHS